MQKGSQEGLHIKRNTAETENKIINLKFLLITVKKIVVSKAIKSN